jgi:hypothetical protein
MNRLQRTVLVSLGERADHVAAHTGQQLNAPAVVHVPLPQSPDAGGEEALAATLLTALQQVSRVEVQAEMEAQGLMLDRLDEIELWLVLDVEAVTRMETALWARRLLADLAWQHSRCTLDTRVLVMAAPHRATETRTLLTALEAESPPPSLVFLVSPVNRRGLSLTEEALCARLPLALRWLLVAPLREAVIQTPGSAEAETPSEPIRLLSLGAAVYPDPAATVLAWCVRRWQAQALGWLLAPAAAETLLPALPAADEALRWLLPWQPESLYERLMALTDACWQRRNRPNGRYLGRWPWSQVRSAMLAARDDDETERRAFQTEAVALCERWAQQRREDLHRRLAATLTGGVLDLDGLGRVLTACRQHWQAWAQEWESGLLQAEDERQDAEARLQATETALMALLQPLVAASEGAWPWFWLNPRSWLWIVRAYFGLPEAMQAYEAAHMAWRRSVLAVLRLDRMRQDCLAAAQDVATAQTHLERLQQALHAAHETLAATAEPEGWEAIRPFDRDDAVRLYDELMGDGRTALGHCLRRHPATAWTATPAGVLAVLEQFGHRWLSPLRMWGADRFVAYALDDDEEALRAWWQTLLDQAMPLWPEGLRRDEAIGTAVVLVNPETSPLAALIPREGNDVWWLTARPPVPLTVIRWQRLGKEVIGNW